MGRKSGKACDPVPNSPKWKGQVSAYWSIPGVWGTEDLFFYYDISFQGKSWNSIEQSVSDNNDENGIVPSWNVSNLRFRRESAKRMVRLPWWSVTCSTRKPCPG